MVALCHPFPMRFRLWLGISVLVVLLATAPGVQAHGDEVVPFDETIPAGAAVDGTPTSMSPHGNLSVPEDARRAHLRLNWTPTTGTDPALRLAVLDGPSSITGEQVIVSQTGKSPLQLSVPVDDVETLGWRVQAHDGLAANQYVQGKAHFEASPPEDPDASPDATDEPRTASQPTPESSGPDTSAPLAAESVAHGAALAGLLVVLLRRLDRPLGVLLGLYSRLSDDEIAEHPQRHRILSLLEDEPGLHLGAPPEPSTSARARCATTWPSSRRPTSWSVGRPTATPATSGPARIRASARPSLDCARRRPRRSSRRCARGTTTASAPSPGRWTWPPRPSPTTSAD